MRNEIGKSLAFRQTPGNIVMTVTIKTSLSKGNSLCSFTLQNPKADKTPNGDKEANMPQKAKVQKRSTENKPPESRVLLSLGH